MRGIRIAGLIHQDAQLFNALGLHLDRSSTAAEAMSRSLGEVHRLAGGELAG